MIFVFLQKKVMRLRIMISLALLLFSVSLFAQRESFRIEQSGITPSGIGANDGKVMIEQDAALLEVVKNHRDVNDGSFPGWRVQVYFGTGHQAMAQAKSIKEKFVLRYGHKHGSYIVYDAPYFKVRVGDFRTKAEALYFESKIKKDFSSSWVVPDKVNYPDKIHEE